MAPSAPRRLWHWSTLALLVALVALPLIAGEYYVNFASQILIAGLFAASLNLLVGYGGLPSLGHASYLGLAAYVSAWLFLCLGLDHVDTAAIALAATTAASSTRE